MLKSCHGNFKTKKLILFLRLNGLKQHISVPIRLTGFERSCIDFFISNIDTKDVVPCGTLNDLISDHLSVYICVKRTRNNPDYIKTKGQTYRQYNKKDLQHLIMSEDWETYYRLLDPTDLWYYILTIIR